MARGLADMGMLVAHNVEVHAHAETGAIRLRAPGDVVTLRGHRQLGEIDFLCRLPDQEDLVHLELAVKFYLYDPRVTVDPSLDSPELWRFVGPRRRDSLGAKLAVLRERQLPLVRRPPVTRALEQRGWPPGRSEIGMPGRLFYPAGTPGPTPEWLAACGLASDHPRGLWTSIDQVPTLLAASSPESGPRRYWALDRPQWLAPLELHPDRGDPEPVDGPGLMDQLDGLEQPRQVSVVVRRGRAWLEATRMFITPRDW